MNLYDFVNSLQSENFLELSIKTIKQYNIDIMTVHHSRKYGITK